MTLRPLTASGAFLGMFLIGACTLSAGSITATTSGWFTNGGESASEFFPAPSPPLTGYAAGYDQSDFSSNPQIVSDFFVFDLSSVTGPIESASLDLFLPFSGYDSMNASDSYIVTGTSSSIAALTTNEAMGSGAGQAVFSTLGTGTLFGSTTVYPGEQGTTLDITFNAAGLAFLNAGIGGQVALSGQVLGVSIGGGDDLVFDLSNPAPAAGGFPATPAPTLDISTVPEPASMALMLAGLVLIFIRVRPLHWMLAAGSKRFKALSSL